tara:strand:+ start:602 stop:1213 length:612 start_codon:yes stop_codon:yes gene_type:complete
MYSTISIVLTIVTGLLCFISYHDDMGIEIPYLAMLLKIVPILLVILLVLKSNLRWQALFKVKKINAFKVSRDGWKKCVVYEFFQCVLCLFISVLLFNYYEKGTALVIVLIFYIIESVSHVIIGRKLYKVIVRENAITIINNNLIIIPWNEIIGIVRRHNDLQFKLNNNTIRILDQDLINPNEMDSFYNQIKEIALKKNIFIET